MNGRHTLLGNDGGAIRFYLEQSDDVPLYKMKQSMMVEYFMLSRVRLTLLKHHLMVAKPMLEE